MEKYELREQFAAGSYGAVFRARNRENGRTVAIKVMEHQYDTWEHAMSEKDIQVLNALPPHPNCVALLDKFYDNSKLCLVFDCFDCTLLQMIQAHRLNQFQHRNLVYKLLQAVFHLHQNSYMHRDLKPENILLKHPEHASTEISDFTFASARLAVCDFGLTKNQRQKPHSDYISTRWYRAPEQLLGFTDYDCKIDIFSAGCVVAEMYSGTTLFAGKSQIDQLAKIIEVCGFPQPIGSPRLKQICDRLTDLKLAARVERYSKAYCKQNVMLVLGCSEKLADLIANMLNWDPIERFGAAQCLSHNFFAID